MLAMTLQSILRHELDPKQNHLSTLSPKLDLFLRYSLSIKYYIQIISEDRESEGMQIPLKYCKIYHRLMVHVQWYNVCFP